MSPIPKTVVNYFAPRSGCSVQQNLARSAHLRLSAWLDLGRFVTPPRVTAITALKFFEVISRFCFSDPPGDHLFGDVFFTHIKIVNEGEAGI